MAAFLVLPDGADVAVEDGMVLGRVSGCDVVVKDTKASRRHARLISRGGVVEIEDLESSNGTKLNGKPLTRRMLRDGDVIKIGTTEFRFREKVVAPKAGGHTFEGGEDLFGDDEPTPPRPETPPSPPPAAVALAAPAPIEPREPDRAVSPRPAEPVVEVRSGGERVVEEVLEFADDDVVTVRRTVPETKKTAEPVPVRESGILQFNKVEDRGALISQDLNQMSMPMRVVLVLVAVAVAGGLFYLAMRLAS